MWVSLYINGNSYTTITEIFWAHRSCVSGLFIYLYCKSEITTSKVKKKPNPLNSPIGDKGNGTRVNMH